MKLENIGMILGEINDDTKELKTEFISLNEAEFEVVEFDVTNILSKEELIEELNNKDFSNINYLEIVLIGKRKFEIETNQILKYLVIPNIVKIKNRTTLEVDLEAISRQNNLKGIFIKKLLEKEEKEPENKEKIEKAIEIGLRFI